MCVYKFYNDLHFSCWFTLIIEKYIQLHVCSSLNKQSEGCWVSKDKWDITDVDKTCHHPESISLWNYIAMQKLFRAEIAICVFNSAWAYWGQGGSLMKHRNIEYFSWKDLPCSSSTTDEALHHHFFPLHIPDDSETYDSVRTFFPLHSIVSISEDRSP